MSDHAAGIGRAPLARFQVIDPGQEDAVGLGKQVENCWRDFLFLPEPEVENLLNRPRRFTQILQPDHSPTTLEGVN